MQDLRYALLECERYKIFVLEYFFGKTLLGNTVVVNMHVHNKLLENGFRICAFGNTVCEIEVTVVFVVVIFLVVVFEKMYIY